MSRSQKAPSQLIQRNDLPEYLIKNYRQHPLNSIRTYPMYPLKTLTLATLLAISSTCLAAGHQHRQQGMDMKHANPMPNLMRVIMRHGDELDLSEEQSKALAAWRDSHHTPMHDMVREVREKEQAIFEATLDGKSKQELMSMLEEILEIRRTIAAGKADCRDNMQRILKPEQYQKVVDIYRRDHPSH